ILIADEPTTALDVTIQPQILDLLKDLQEETGSGIILITHDLGVVAEMADRLGVMYAVQFVEVGTAGELFRHPKHPYTRSF
ncbi:ABC transporter ATP-binding protein, partial [Enterococcus faecalis]